MSVNHRIREKRNEINIVSQPTNTEIINNSGVCILSISFIFLIITIIFFNYFGKIPTKIKKKNCLNNRKVIGGIYEKKYIQSSDYNCSYTINDNWNYVFN